MRTGLCVLALACVATARADELNESFSGPSPHPALCFSATPGYDVRVANGRLEMSKQPGSGNGTTSLAVRSRITGDFVMTARCGRPDLAGNGEAGIGASFEGASFVDIFFFGAGAIHANMFQGGGGFRTIADAAPEVTFRIRRVGSILFLEYDGGSGFVTLHSFDSPALVGPCSINGFMINEFGNPGAQLFWLDDYHVIADNLTPTNCVADFDDGRGDGLRDCGVTIDDLLFYLGLFGDGDVRADIDDGTFTNTPDGGVTIDDLLYYLQRFADGC